MIDIPVKIALVIPCYNEAKRIALDKFESFHQNVHFLFVDDGSVDDTARHIRENLPSNSYLLRLKKNWGKGEAVRQGMIHLKNMALFNELTWLGYWDADLSTPLEAVGDYLKYQTLYEGRIDSIFGSRIYKLGSEIRRSHVRHIFGRLFATYAFIWLRVKSYDSQCGAKLFRKEMISVAFGRPFISKWVFDLEIILRLDGYPVVECPLRQWHDVKGSKVNFFIDPFRAMIDILKIRDEYRKSGHRQRPKNDRLGCKI